MGAGVNLFKTLFAEDYYPYTANTLMSCKPTSKVIKDSDNQTIQTITLSGVELRGLIKVGTNGLYADGDIDDGSGTGEVRYGIVDLGDLNYSFGFGGIQTSSLVSVIKSPTTSQNSGLICECFITGISGEDVCYIIQAGSTYEGRVVFLPSITYATADDFKTAVTGKYLVYELATPTTQTLTAWNNPIKACEGGTEEFTDTRTIKLPSGHDTIYSKKTDYRYW